MIQDTEISRDDFVFKEGSRWNIDSFTMVRNDDHSTLECDIFSKSDITADCQMIKFQHVRDVGEPAHKFVNQCSTKLVAPPLGFSDLMTFFFA